MSFNAKASKEKTDSQSGLGERLIAAVGGSWLAISVQCTFVHGIFRFRTREAFSQAVASCGSLDIYFTSRGSHRMRKKKQKRELYFALGKKKDAHANRLEVQGWTTFDWRMEEHNAAAVAS
jgi:hypothetical protein